MQQTTLTSKGQVTLPKAIRDVMKLQSGDRLACVVRDDGVLEMRPIQPDLLALCGTIDPQRKGLTVDDMQQAIYAGALDQS